MGASELDGQSDRDSGESVQRSSEGGDVLREKGAVRGRGEDGAGCLQRGPDLGCGLAHHLGGHGAVVGSVTATACGQTRLIAGQ